MTDSIDLEEVEQAQPAVVVAIAEDFDPLDDTQLEANNFGKVGSLRPSALLYTSGIGATVDLPHISVMVQGLEAWDRIYTRMGKPKLIQEPRLLDAVRAQLGSTVNELRLPPWEQGDVGQMEAVKNLGVPVTVFPKWLRCTGCSELAPVTSSTFEFVNRNPYRPDQAEFVHNNCPGHGSSRGKSGANFKKKKRSALPARYQLACGNGHLDEFPYVEWVHRAIGSSWSCPSGANYPKLKLLERQSNIGPSVTVKCEACGQMRQMRDATGVAGEDKLPACRGRHPHLGTFETCGLPTKLMLLGAANQWFPATIGLIVLPTLGGTSITDLDGFLRQIPPAELALVDSPADVKFLRKDLINLGADLDALSDEALWAALERFRMPSSEASQDAPKAFDPISLLLPEWVVLSDPSSFVKVSEKSSFKVTDHGRPLDLQPIVDRVVAVDRMKKVNAFIGFTRIDPEDRIGDERDRLAPIGRRGSDGHFRPTWVPATEDRGEGVFLRFNEHLVAGWEAEVLTSEVWAAHRASHERNYARRVSRTSASANAASRFQPPRYWALHTLSHMLIREMAMDCGYGTASLNERLYAWRESDDRPAAAGILICTTAPDSEGTLGGVVALAEPGRITRLVRSALRRAARCSSDPICAQRLPKDPEEFLHGAACHFCTFASETSCERANRFLDRRFVIDLPGSDAPGLFQALLGS